MKPSRREWVGAALLVSHPGTIRAAPKDDLTALTLTDAAALLRKKAVSPVDLVRACLARIERLNPRLNAYITVTAGFVGACRDEGWRWSKQLR